MNNLPIKKYASFLFIALLASCSKSDDTPKQPHQLHYVIGDAYQLGNNWIYPKEDFAYKATGIATVSPSKSGKITADGEVYDPQSMTGSHPTLQLPAIVKVRNLDNGREITIRLNDRNSSIPERVIELSPKAASLLNITKQQPGRVEIIEDENQSQKLAFDMPNGPQTQMKVETAPLNNITVENLNDGGSSQKNTNPLEKTPENVLKTPISLLDLPATYSQGVATGGQLWIDGGSFTSRTYADRLAATMDGRLVYTYSGGRRVIRVRSGPYSSVEQADQKLDYLLKSGIKGAKIIVE